jgi:hypothetical protein
LNIFIWVCNIFISNCLSDTKQHAYAYIKAGSWMTEKFKFPKNRVWSWRIRESLCSMEYQHQVVVRFGQYASAFIQATKTNFYLYFFARKLSLFTPTYTPFSYPKLHILLRTHKSSRTIFLSNIRNINHE